MTRENNLTITLRPMVINGEKVYLADRQRERLVARLLLEAYRKQSSQYGPSWPFSSAVTDARDSQNKRKQ